MASRAASGREDEEGERTMMKRPVMRIINASSEDYRNNNDDNQVLATRLLLLHLCLKGCICFFPTAFDL